MGPQASIFLPNQPFPVSTSWYCSKISWPQSYNAYPPFCLLHRRWSGTVASKLGMIPLSVTYHGNHLNLSLLCPVLTQHTNVPRIHRHRQRGRQLSPLRSIWYRLLSDRHWHFCIRIYTPQQVPIHFIQGTRRTIVQGYCDRFEDWGKVNIEFKNWRQRGYHAHNHRPQLSSNPRPTYGPSVPTTLGTAGVRYKPIDVRWK